MKKKQIAGLLGVILIALACYVAYYRFWMALVGFGLSAVALPIAFWLISRKGAWFSLPFAGLLDVVLYWQAYGYYESRGLFVYATLAQFAVMAVILLLLAKRWGWGAVAMGMVLFAVTIPFYHDMYIPKVFTGICICLNGLSAILLAKFLHRVGTKGLNAERRVMFTLGVIAQAIGHGVFSIMNWGSWLFLGLSVVALVVLAATHVKDKMRENI